MFVLPEELRLMQPLQVFTRLFTVSKRTLVRTFSKNWSCRQFLMQIVQHNLIWPQSYFVNFPFYISKENTWELCLPKNERHPPAKLLWSRIWTGLSVQHVFVDLYIYILFKYKDLIAFKSHFSGGIYAFFYLPIWTFLRTWMKQNLNYLMSNLIFFKDRSEEKWKKK